VTAALLLVLPSSSAVMAGDNQLIDDFWMREKAPRQAQPAPPAEALRKNKNQLIDDFWMRKKAPRQGQPARPVEAPHPIRGTPVETEAAPATSASTEASQSEPAGRVEPPVQAPVPDPVATVEPAVMTPSAPASTPQDGRIHPNDRISVQVHQVDELSTVGAVSEDGRFEMPLIGPIEVAGLTTEEAEARIADALGRDYLQDPRVRVQVQGRGPSGEPEPETDAGDSRPGAVPETASRDHDGR